jgi:4-hydroxythreonine-4-phosphate dehydrogenase
MVDPSNRRPAIAVTLGDPTGIGPEIIVRALADPQVQGSCRPLILGDRRALERAMEVVSITLPLVELPEGVPVEGCDPASLYIRPLTRLADKDLQYGRPTAASGDALYRYIVEAAKLCTAGIVEAMATAPISKEAMNRAGHHYPGHTELLAELTNSHEVVMMLAGSRLRVTLVTIHEALRQVPELITFERVLSTIRVTHRDLSRYLCPKPRIAVLALNPHCGEGGMFGDEEGRIIAPAVAAAQEEGIDATGPLSADTLFHFAVAGDYDCVVCMYHDQGLIPLKLLHFDDGVNVSLGLPIIRTSVDHGTAYNLAGTGKASAASMKAALLTAADMARVKASGSR